MKGFKKMLLMLSAVVLASGVVLMCHVSQAEASVGPMIYIGDSRGEGLRLSLSEEQKKKVTFYTEVSQGYNWLEQTVIPQVNTMLYSHPKKKYKIVVNLGINDFSYNMQNYVKKYNSLAKNEWANYDIFIMSVTPVDNEKMVATCKYPKKNADIAKANKYLRENLDKSCSNLHFVGFFKKMRNGEKMAEGYETGYDGAHYTGSTYLKIWEMLLERMNRILQSKNLS